MSTLNELFSGYNSKYRMTKCLDTSTTVINGELSTNLLDANFHSSVDTGIVDALASIGLLTMLENDTNILQLETRLKALISGQFAARRKDGSSATSAKTLPDSIEKLPVADLEAIVGSNKTKVTLSVADLKKYGMLDLLADTHKKDLQEFLDLQIENAERLKVLFELFKISNASIDTETDKTLTINCIVSSSQWNSTFTKIRASADRGWSVDKSSLKPVGDDMLEFSFDLILDKTINPVAE